MYTAMETIRVRLGGKVNRKRLLWVGLRDLAGACRRDYTCIGIEEYVGSLAWEVCS